MSKSDFSVAYYPGCCKKGRLVGPFQHCSEGWLYSYPQMSSFIHLQRRHAPRRRRKELSPRNLVSKSWIYESTMFFYMPQIWDMGQILSLPLRRKVCWGFFGHPKNPTSSAGFEPANSGTRDQHADVEGKGNNRTVAVRKATKYQAIDSQLLLSYSWEPWKSRANSTVVNNPTNS